MKLPKDRTPYPRDPASRPMGAGLADGPYVFVQDVNGVVHVIEDGPHLHPKVLGGGSPAMYAGDLTIANGIVVDVTNLSGTFALDDEAGLRAVADELRRAGLLVSAGAVRFFPADGSPPIILA